MMMMMTMTMMTMMTMLDVGDVKVYDDDDDDDDDDDHVGDVKDYDDSKRSPVAACKHRPVSLLASSVPNLICEECGIVFSNFDYCSSLFIFIFHYWTLRASLLCLLAFQEYNLYFDSFVVDAHLP